MLDIYSDRSSSQDLFAQDFCWGLIDIRPFKIENSLVFRRPLILPYIGPGAHFYFFLYVPAIAILLLNRSPGATFGYVGR